MLELEFYETIEHRQTDAQRQWCWSSGGTVQKKRNQRQTEGTEELEK